MTFYRVYEKIVPDTICDEVYEMLSQEQFKMASLNDEVSNLRLGQDCHVKDEKYFSKLFPFLQKIVPPTFNNRRFVSIDKNSCYALSYFSGQYFDIHVDGRAYDQNANVSLLTIQLYLTSSVKEIKDFDRECIGGSTILFNDHYGVVSAHQFSKGDVLIFDQAISHCGDTVVDGTKVTLRFNVIYDLLDDDTYRNVKDLQTLMYHRHMLTFPVATFTFETKNHLLQGLSNAMNPNYDICTCCSSLTRWDLKNCEYCGSEIKIEDEKILEKRRYSYFVPR